MILDTTAPRDRFDPERRFAFFDTREAARTAVGALIADRDARLRERPTARKAPAQYRGEPSGRWYMVRFDPYGAMDTGRCEAVLRAAGAVPLGRLRPWYHSGRAAAVSSKLAADKR